MLTVFSTFGFNGNSLLRSQQNDRMFQVLLMPLFQSRLRQLMAFSAPSPTASISLEVSAVDGPVIKKAIGSSEFMAFGFR